MMARCSIQSGDDAAWHGFQGLAADDRLGTDAGEDSKNTP